MPDDPHDLPPKRKPGRPRLPEHKQGYSVATWMTPTDYDKLIKAANRYDVSVSKLVRVWIRQQLKMPP